MPSTPVWPVVRFRNVWGAVRAKRPDTRFGGARRALSVARVMRPTLLMALLVAVALTAGAAFGFLLEQATQPEPTEQSAEP